MTGPLHITEMARSTGRARAGRGRRHHWPGRPMSQGVARALKTMFSPTEEAKPAEAPPRMPVRLVWSKPRDSGYLTRDGRMKERKKYGRKGARRSFQFSKR